MRPTRYDKTSLPRHRRGGLFLPPSRRGWLNSGYKNYNQGYGRRSISWVAALLRIFALIKRWSEK